MPLLINAPVVCKPVPPVNCINPLLVTVPFTVSFPDAPQPQVIVPSLTKEPMMVPQPVMVPLEEICTLVTDKVPPSPDDLAAGGNHAER